MKVTIMYCLIAAAIILLGILHYAENLGNIIETATAEPLDPLTSAGIGIVLALVLSAICRSIWPKKAY